MYEHVCVPAEPKSEIDSQYACSLQQEDNREWFMDT